MPRRKLITPLPKKTKRVLTAPARAFNRTAETAAKVAYKSLKETKKTYTGASKSIGSVTARVIRRHTPLGVLKSATGLVKDISAAKRSKKAGAKLKKRLTKKRK